MKFMKPCLLICSEINYRSSEDDHNDAVVSLAASTALYGKKWGIPVQLFTVNKEHLTNDILKSTSDRPVVYLSQDILDVKEKLIAKVVGNMVNTDIALFLCPVTMDMNSSREDGIKMGDLARNLIQTLEMPVVSVINQIHGDKALGHQLEPFVRSHIEGANGIVLKNSVEREVADEMGEWALKNNVQYLGCIEKLAQNEKLAYSSMKKLTYLIETGFFDKLFRLASKSPGFDIADKSSDAPKTSLKAGSEKKPRISLLNGISNSKKAKVLMIQGATSNAGKTFLVTAMARYFSNLGLKVAPFKGQNMSNNARVVEGGEIGVAQYFQALAARAEPDVRMNPVLIKPNANNSQAILMGKHDPELSRMPWRMRKPLSWPSVQESLHSLCRDYDLVIVEGAGSPIEPYLRDNDIVNMRVALEVNATVLIAADAARGGAFPHLYGTWAMMSAEEKKLIKGFILNLFFSNGDPTMLHAAFGSLSSITGNTPVLGVVPEIEHQLPDEDMFSLDYKSVGEGCRFTVAIISYPQLSNFDEFKPLEAVPELKLIWATKVSDLNNADLIILPGSKHVSADLRWIRKQGFDKAIKHQFKLSTKILGICGGLQILGGAMEDPHGVEESGEGFCLLPVKTVYLPEKIQRRISAKFGRINGPWEALSGLQVEGFEIRHGRAVPTGQVDEVIADGVGFAMDNLLGIYVHGMFENQGILSACFSVDLDVSSDLEQTFDHISKSLETYLDMPLVEKLVFN